MKIGKIIARMLSLLLRLWITACAAVMMYVPMSALAYAERGYKAVGGEWIVIAGLTVTVWYLMGLLLREWYKGTLAMIRLSKIECKDGKNEN